MVLADDAVIRGRGLEHWLIHALSFLKETGVSNPLVHAVIAITTSTGELALKELKRKYKVKWYTGPRRWNTVRESLKFFDESDRSLPGGMTAVNAYNNLFPRYLADSEGSLDFVIAGLASKIFDHESTPYVPQVVEALYDPLLDNPPPQGAYYYYFGGRALLHAFVTGPEIPPPYKDWIPKEITLPSDHQTD